jgi:tRNA pseudouridine55 synthase
MRGVLNANKPSGISSYDVIRRIKPLLHRSTSIGHAGTLDPLASGVLLVLLGEATKVSRFLLNLPKEYVAEVLLGRQTDTDDITGKTVAERPVTDLTEESVRAALDRFVGETEQIPPAFSALKQNGQPLYRLARSGREVHPKSRKVMVYELELLGWQAPTAAIRCRVSAGTYVRALARDLGTSLGTVATLASLVRTKVGQFTIETSTTLDAIDATSLNDRLVPVAAALDGMPRIAVSPDQALHLLQGKVLRGFGASRLSGSDGLGVAESDDHRFLAIVVADKEELRTERIVYAD